MARVYLSLGSNVNREHYIGAALDALAQQFGALVLSSVYESEAVGFAGDNFYNLVVGIDTELELVPLAATLRALEYANDRCRVSPRYSAKTLDIDILTYADRAGVHDGILLPRDEVLTNAFVLQPLAEIAGAELHPARGRSYAELWGAYREPQRLWTVDFCWRGRAISVAASPVAITAEAAASGAAESGKSRAAAD